MVAHPERLSNEIIDCGTLNFIRNRRSMLTLVETATDDVGMRPEFVLGDKWRDLDDATTFLWGEKDITMGEHPLGQKPDRRQA